MFETFVVGEVLKSFVNNGEDPHRISFYRDGRKREIDLVIEESHVLHPDEIKMVSNSTKDSIAAFSVLEGIPDYEVGFGAVICQTPISYLISPTVQAVSVFDI